MPHRLLRSLAGLPVGASFVLDRRLLIGRAVDCDVQLVDALVSRHHAKVEVDASGAAVLVDLASRGGTLVDGMPVDRILLHHGATISIAGFKLRFEESLVPVNERRTRRVAGMHALRVTAVFEAPPITRRRTTGTTRATTATAPAGPGPVTRVVEPPIAVPRISRSADTLRPDVTNGAGVSLPVASPPADAVEPASQELVHAALVRAVVELRRQEVPVTSATEPLLSTEPAPGRRQHPRFRCTMRGWLARRDADRISTRAVSLRDLAFGGACVEWVDDVTQLDPKMWLVLDIEDEQAPMVVLPARLVWAAPGSRAAGLAFVGRAGIGLDALELIRMS